MTKTIIVGIDGSDAARSAVVWAAELAAANDAIVQPVMTWEYPTSATIPAPLGVPVPPADTMRDAAQGSLDELLDVYRESLPADAAGVVQPGRVVRGPAARTLCRVGEDADLLVVGSRGLGGFKSLVLGSVSSHCANAASCPVVIVPTGLGEETSPRSGVLVAIDGSENADAAVRWADTWAPQDSKLHLLHGWVLPVSYDWVPDEADQQHFEALAQEVIDNATAIVTRHDVVGEAQRGDPRVLLAERGPSAEMVVLGRRGHTGLSWLVLGSVASDAVHHLHGPTVIVPGADH